MAARSLALALLLLLCVTPVGWAAEPDGAKVVLQLPASMSPDQIKGLIADPAPATTTRNLRWGLARASAGGGFLVFLLYQKGRDARIDQRLINVESEAEYEDRPHGDAVCGPWAKASISPATPSAR
jgi:hypothetical protein